MRQTGCRSSSSLLLVLALTGNECSAGPKPRPLTVVAPNKPAPVIVLSPQATEAERWAAEELTTAIREMTGTSPEVNTAAGVESLPPNSSAFVLGVLPRTPVLQPFLTRGALRVPEGRPRHDGFVVKLLEEKKRPVLIITGRQPRSVLNGVFHLLERVWHCGFFEQGVRYPKSKNLTVPVLHEIIEPAFENREAIYLPDYTYPQWPEEKRLRHLDHLCRLRYNRFSAKWDRYYDLVRKELHERGKPSDFNEQRYGEMVRELQYWRRRDGLWTGHLASAMWDMFASDVKKAYPEVKVHTTHGGGTQYDFVDPADAIAFDLDLAVGRKAAALGVDGWWLFGVPGEVQWSATPEKKRRVMLEFGRQALKALEEVDAKGTLSLNGWSLIFSPWTVEDYQALFDMIPRGKLVVYDTMALDGVSTRKRYDWYRGHLWMLGAIPLLQSGDWMHTDLPGALRMAQEVLDAPEAKNLVGFAWQTEANESNPMVLDLIHLMAWNPAEWTMQRFLEDYALRRYGQAGAAAMPPVLQKLVESVYGPQRLNWGLYYMPPPHQAIRVGADFLHSQGFENQASFAPTVGEALELALAAASVLQDDPFYTTDLIDLARAYCHCCEFAWQMQAWYALQKGDAGRVREASKAVGTVLDSEILILATHPRYWNETTTFGAFTNDYYAPDTYELLKHLYAPRLRKQMENFQQCVAKGEKMPGDYQWRRRILDDTRNEYDRHTEWHRIPESERHPMSPVQAARKVLHAVADVNSKLRG